MEAPDRNSFCSLIAQARTHKLPGVLEGSAFREHPVMLFRRNILLVNQWNVNNYCYAEAFTVHPVTFKPWCKDSLAHADPYPRPAEGQAIRFYDAFRGWQVEGPWQQIMLDVLAEVRDEIEAAKRDVEIARRVERAAQEAARTNTIADAAALYSGAA